MTVLMRLTVFNDCRGMIRYNPKSGLLALVGSNSARTGYFHDMSVAAFIKTIAIRFGGKAIRKCRRELVLISNGGTQYPYNTKLPMLQVLISATDQPNMWLCIDGIMRRPRVFVIGDLKLGPFRMKLNATCSGWRFSRALHRHADRSFTHYNLYVDNKPLLQYEYLPFVDGRAVICVECRRRV